MKTGSRSKQTRQIPHLRAQSDGGFTLTDLLVVLATVGMLGLLALPALASNKGKSKTLQCLSNLRQISMGTALFAQENGCYPPLFRQPNVSGWPNWTYDATKFVVKNANALFWPDALRLEGYLKDSSIFSCPLLTVTAPYIGGAMSTNYSLGIGMNHPEIGAVFSTGLLFPHPYKPSDVKTPSQTVIFGDSGSVTTASKDLNPDSWVSDTAFDVAIGNIYGGGSTYFRSPSSGATYSTGDARMLPRHDGRVVAGWADGHGSIIKNSQIGWQYYSGGAVGSLQPAGALWARNHN